MTGLLSGFRVVELSVLLNGATTGMMLADLGADVVKIESPFLGDYIRIPSTAHLHAQVNKNKRSVAVDLQREGGRRILHRMVSDADVFVTNLLPRSLTKLGADYDRLSTVNPDLVYCQVTGFGASGPLSDVPSHGQMMDSLAGALPGEIGPDGLARARRPPAVRSGSLTVAGEGTATGAVYAALYVAAALAGRPARGAGCYLDVSATDAVVASAWTAVAAQLNTPESSRWWLQEDAGRHTARYQHYVTSDDKFVMFCPEEKKFWETFCDLVDRPDLKPRESGYELRTEIQKIIGTQTRAHWLGIAVEHRLPIGPVNDGADELRSDPQLAARGIFVEGASPTGEPFTYVGSPVMVDGRRPQAPVPAPELGADTDAVLRDLGFTDEERATFQRDQVTRSDQRVEGYISEQIHTDGS
jgi:crotonobetainyl-CoA:carnitine CoA-transferase CaiB-like acyl-CoA transferase